MKFYFDNCLSRHIARAISALDSVNSFETAYDREWGDLKDTEWIPRLASEPEIVVITADEAIMSRKIDKRAWRDSGLTGFFFRQIASEKLWPQAIRVVRSWPQILETLKTAPRPSTWLFDKDYSKNGPKDITMLL